MTQDEIIREFVFQASKQAGPVTFGQRAGRNGYTKVFGPNASATRPGTCHISIEHKYPAVSVTAQLAAAMGATAPRTGWSAGPNGGRFQHEILLTQATAQYKTAQPFVAALIAAATKYGTW
jgi:hypothetical protein